MFEWMLGLLTLAIVIAFVLAYLEVVDPFALLAEVVRLIAGLLFAIGAFFVWLVKQLRHEKRS